MLETADVFIENFKMSTWRKWGIDDLDVITRRFPRLVHCRVSGFGEDGEFGGLPGYDAALQAMSGMMSVNGEPTADATRVGMPIVDTSTGMHGAMGILLALLERNRSGLGQRLEVTLYDCAISMLHPHVSNVLYGGRAVRTGNGHPNIVPYDLFATARCRSSSPSATTGSSRRCARRWTRRISARTRAMRRTASAWRTVCRCASRSSNCSRATTA
jgi:crotonobetainyl-CoA:carnitine CoA-transferase CaiB-like acyl-CoA transferase